MGKLFRIILEDYDGKHEVEVQSPDLMAALDDGLRELGEPLEGRDEGNVTLRIERAD